MHSGTPIKHGRYSKLLPQSLKRFFSEDAAVQSIEEEVSLQTAVIAHATEALAFAADLGALGKAIAAAEAAGQTTIPVAVVKEHIGTAKALEGATDRISRLSTAKAKLVDCRTRQMAQAQSHVTAADLGRLQLAIRDTLQHAVLELAGEALGKAILMEVQRRMRELPGLGYVQDG
jgi:hypothetical protein